MSSGEAMRCCAMSHAMLTICAMTRCATNPGESRITETGTPSLASNPCAAARIAGAVTGVVMSVRRLSSANRQSTASVRVGSSPSSSAVAVASRPTGATRYSDCAAGWAPASTRAPSFATSSASLGRGRLGDFFLLGVLVAVEAAPGFAAQQPRVHALGGEGRRAEPRFLVILPVDRFHHRVRDVEARQIEQLDRAQAESGAVAQDAVDPVELRDALAENAQSLG